VIKSLISRLVCICIIIIMIFLRKPFPPFTGPPTTRTPARWRYRTLPLDADDFPLFLFRPFVHYSNFFLSATSAVALLRGVFDTRVISILFRTHARAHSHHIILYIILCSPACVEVYLKQPTNACALILYYIILLR